MEWVESHLPINSAHVGQVQNYPSQWYYTYKISKEFYFFNHVTFLYFRLNSQKFFLKLIKNFL